MVEFLVTVCGVNIEGRETYEVSEDRTIHFVTPLWCAAISNRLNVVKCLVRLGANINAVSDTGSTPVRSACFMSNIAVVKFLVENGADIRKCNQNAGTCLINSVQSVELCQYLILRGVDVNAQDIQGKSALHYAVQENLLDTVQLLIDQGADPFAKSRHGDDALQTACLKGADEIFEFLKGRITYSAERLASAHELLGATFFDDRNQTQLAISHWRIALTLRLQNPAAIIGKLPEVPIRIAYMNQQEFMSFDDLDSIAHSIDDMRIQSLLIYERVLGLDHKDTLFRLMFRGAKYADSLQYPRCIDLWTLALQARVEKYSILHSDTVHTAQAVVRLFLDLFIKNFFMYTDPAVEGLPKYREIFRVLELLTTDIATARDALLVQPVFKKQQENFDRILRCVTHLIFLLLQEIESHEDIQAITNISWRLIAADIRSSTKDTLLHLSCSRLNVVKSSYFSNDHYNSFFPDRSVIMHFLACGANINAINESRSTPLLVCSLLYNFEARCIKTLLDLGAHLDQPNKNNELPLTQIQANPDNEIQYLKYLSLRCLAAQVVARYRIPYKNIVPKTLEHFVRCHEP